MPRIFRTQDSAATGGRALFVTHDVVLRGGNDNVDLKWSRWDGTKVSDPVPVEPPGYPAGAQFLPILSRVVYPTFTDPAGGALMLAIAGDAPPTGDLFGFFDKGAATSPASERFYWKKLGKVPFEVAGLGSLTGRRIIVGTAYAHAYQLDALTGNVVELSLPTGLGNEGIRWVRVANTSLAFCLAGNTLLRTTNVTTWTSMAGPPGTTLDVIDIDRRFDPVALVAAGSDGAWVSRTNGVSWQPTFDLPRHPQANHLEVVHDGGAGRVVHLSTWNRSAWRARLA